jgi:uncharacterized protein (TIGR02266 family)
MSASESDLASVGTHTTLATTSFPSGIRRVAGHERRAGVRVALEVEVSLESDSNFFVGLSGDVSRGGLFVVTWRKLAVGTGIFVAIDLPEGRLLVDGEIRWVREATGGGTPGLGIAFMGLSEQDRQRIGAFCARRRPLCVDVEEVGSCTKRRSP